MQETVQKPILERRGKLTWYLALILLLVVIGWAIWLYAYDTYLSTRIESEKVSTAEINKQIEEISKDRDIIITKIVSSSTIRPSLDIKALVTEFREAAIRAGVKLKGFSVDKDVVSTTLTATEWDPQTHPDPAATIIRMMREYALGQKYFSLEPIYSLSWDEKSRTTGITLKVTPKPLQK